MGIEEERQSAKPLYNSLYMGFVEDRADPKGLGRVRIRIPAMLDKKPFPFALPLAMPGGGDKQRGRFQPPNVGAMVGVLFFMGDINQPFYMYAHWGEGEIPTNAVVSGDDEGNYPNETKAWLIEIDDRSPNILRITHKDSGDKIEMNGTTRNLKATIKDSSFEVDGDGDKAKLTSKTSEVEVDGAADKIIIKAGNVELGAAAAEKLILGDAFQTVYNNFAVTQYPIHFHQVISVGAPTGPVLAPNNAPGGLTSSELSSVSKTE